MLSQEQELILSEYSGLYDIVVPQDNLLRRINTLIDFSFVYQELLDKYCPDNGRMAESPIRMFKYLLLKVIYDISDVDVVERSRYDLSFKYFLGMAPEDDVINPSSLCKFRKLRLKDMDLLNLLIEKTVDVAIEKGIIKSRTIIVDATHTVSRSNPYSPIEVLRLRSKQLRKAIYDADDRIKDTLPKKDGKWNQTWTYFFDTDKCKTCSRKEGCYKDGAKSKTYSVSIKTGEQERLMEFQKTPEFKAKSRERYKIEAKNAELKHVYVYDRAKSYGLHSMQMQGAITIFAANVKRILKLI